MSIGATLAAARTSRGLAIQDVAELTKIRASLIRAIEEDRYKDVDAPIFVRAHIKSIALALEVDPQPLLAKFDASHNPDAVAPPLSTEEVDIFAARKRETLPRRSSRGRQLVVIGFAALALLIFLASLLTGGDDGAAALPTMPAASNGSTDAGNDPAVVTLQVAAQAECWLQVVTGDGTLLFEGMLQAGDNQTFTDATEIAVRVGDAAAVSLNVNGIALPPLGGPGEVVERAFGLGNPTTGS